MMSWILHVLLGLPAHRWKFYQVGCIFSDGAEIDEKKVKDVVLNVKQHDVQVATSTELNSCFAYNTSSFTDIEK